MLLLLASSPAPSNAAQKAPLAAAARAKLQELHATPWLLPPSTRLRYEGHHNNLDRLLSLQARKDRWVTVFIFNRAVRRWTMNAIYSYVKFGRSINYVAAAVDESSLVACLRLRLPCYNASLVPEAARKGSGDGLVAEINTQRYLAIVWGKVVMAQRVISRGYHLHLSDVDVVYFRTVFSSYHLLFKKAPHLDAVFMWEEVVNEETGMLNLLNTGVYAMLSNNYTQRLMDDWLDPPGGRVGHDQSTLNRRLAFKSFTLCTSPATCQAAKEAGWATVYRHPPQVRCWNWLMYIALVEAVHRHGPKP